jgi:hypothetical protein
MIQKQGSFSPLTLANPWQAALPDFGHQMATDR